MPAERENARIILLNPNTDEAQTRAMTALAAETAGSTIEVTGATAPFGHPLISNEEALAQAARAVLSLAPTLRTTKADGIIICAFGDPGLEAMRDAVRVPVTGLAEAGMAAAAQGGRRFCVVTTTPALEQVIARSAQRYGHAPLFAGTFFTGEDPHDLMRSPDALVEQLHTTCLRAVAQSGVEAVIIGGGPLAVAARSLKQSFSATLIEPVPEAIRLAIRRKSEQTACAL